MNSPFEAASTRGQLLLNQRRYADAARFFREALASAPRDVGLLYRLAICEYQTDENRRALETIGSAIAILPNAAELHAFKSVVLAALDRPKEAEEAARAAISLEPDDPDAHSALAGALLARKEWKPAENAAREALELDPDHSNAAAHLATALRFQNRHSESEDTVRLMLQRDPENAYHHTNAGWTALHRGDHKAAETHFVEALRLEPENEHAREGLKQAFKARSALYRGYLAFSFFLQKHTEGKQWLIIIGILVVTKISRGLLPGPIALIIGGLYFLFILWMHVAVPVGNLQLLADARARHALDPGEKLEGIVVGGAVVVGLLLLPAGMFLNTMIPIIIGIGLIMLAFPLRYVFTNPSVPGRVVFSLLALVIIAGALPLVIPGFPKETGSGMTGLAVMSFIATTWLCNIPALRRGRAR